MFCLFIQQIFQWVTLTASKYGLTENKKSNRIWEDAIVTYFEMLFQNLTGKTGEKGALLQFCDIQPLGRDLNPGPLEYEAEVISTRPGRSILVLNATFTCCLNYVV
jgi:hypothetical protein